MLLDPYRFGIQLALQANASLNPHNFPVSMWDSPNTAVGSNTAHDFPISMVNDTALIGSNTAHDFPVSIGSDTAAIGSNTAHDFPASLYNIGNGTYSTVVLADNPLIYYRMNESSGTVLTNLGSLGSGFNGTLQGSPTLSAADLINESDASISFDGIDDVAYVGPSASIGTSSSSTVRSVEFWFQSSTSGTTLLALRGTTGNNNDAYLLALLGLITAHKFTLHSGGINAVTSSASYDDGNKHHVWMWYSGGFVSAYIDGVSIGSGAGGGLAANNLKLGIGANVASSSTFIQWSTALIDEVALYNFAPTALQIITHYRAGL